MDITLRPSRWESLTRHYWGIGSFTMKDVLRGKPITFASADVVRITEIKPPYKWRKTTFEVEYRTGDTLNTLTLSALPEILERAPRDRVEASGYRRRAWRLLLAHTVVPWFLLALAVECLAILALTAWSRRILPGIMEGILPERTVVDLVPVLWTVVQTHLVLLLPVLYPFLHRRLRDRFFPSPVRSALVAKSFRFEAFVLVVLGTVLNVHQGQHSAAVLETTVFKETVVLVKRQFREERRKSLALPVIQSTNR